MRVDELCVISGVCREGGPNFLIAASDIDPEVNRVANEIIELTGDRGSGIKIGEDLDSIKAIVKDILLIGVYDPRPWRRVFSHGAWIPPADREWGWFRHKIFVGYLDDPPIDMLVTNQVTAGRNVQFQYWDDGQRFEGFELENPHLTHVQPHFWFTHECGNYMQAWIDFDSLPPRQTAFPNDPEPMNFYGELYEIVNSRKERPSAQPFTFATRSFDLLLPFYRREGSAALHLVRWDREELAGIFLSFP